MNYDPTGIWFEAFEALGEPSDILFDFKVKGENQPIKHLYSHSHGDATAAMSEIANKYNFILRKDVKKNTHLKIGIIHYLKQILLFNYHARPRWQRLWPFKLAKCSHTQTPYCYFTIHKNEVLNLKALLQTQNISLNTYLLFTLDQATRTVLQPIRHDLTWIVPVNLRSDLGLAANAPGNQAANFTCVIKNETPLQLQTKISYLLKSKRHWGVWFWQNASQWMPFFLVKFLTHIRLHPNYNAGVFTNLGEWTSSTEFLHFTFFANPILSHPIVASSLELNGQLTLGLRIYPSFPLTQQQLEAYLQEWKNNILR